MRRLWIVVATISMFAPALPARAQMTPLESMRFNWVELSYAGLSLDVVEDGNQSFDPWENLNHRVLLNPDEKTGGSLEGFAWQVSQIVGQGIYASGTANAGWNHPPLNPDYVVHSTAEFKFRLTTPTAYSLDAWVDPGEYAGNPTYVWLLQAAAPWVNFAERIESGELHRVGRLAPGDYWIRGQASVRGSAEFMYGGTYSYTMLFSHVLDPLIDGQPHDLSVTAGAIATFSAHTSLPTDSLTFQWRRNGVVLTNGGRVSGVNTPTLTISNAAIADSGWFELTVTHGATQEPSRLARLDVVGTQGVPVASDRSGLALELIGPNPFVSNTALRYLVTHRERVTATVFDLAGARVRELLDGDVQGAGTLAWDGRDDGGARVASGLYFVRLSGPSGSTHRTVALLR